MCLREIRVSLAYVCSVPIFDSSFTTFEKMPDSIIFGALSRPEATKSSSDHKSNLISLLEGSDPSFKFVCALRDKPLSSSICFMKQPGYTFRALSKQGSLTLHQCLLLELKGFLLVFIKDIMWPFLLWPLSVPAGLRGHHAITFPRPAVIPEQSITTVHWLGFPAVLLVLILQPVMYVGWS